MSTDTQTHTRVATASDLRADWDKALAAYSAAKQDTSTAAAAHDAAEGTDAFPAIEAEYWRKVDAQSKCGDALIRTPAPDASAVAIKLQIAQIEQGDTLPGWALGEVYADLRRIGGADDPSAPKGPTIPRIIEQRAWEAPTFSGWVLTIVADDETAAETAAAVMGHVADIAPHPRGFAVLVVQDEAPAKATWARLVEAERAAYADMMASESDEAMHAWNAAATAMMNYPAHDLAALRYKLDRLFPKDSDGDSTDAWAWHYAGQTVQDIRRLLPSGEA